MKYILKPLLLWILCLSITQISVAQNSDEAKQVTDSYFISNATVVVSPEKQIPDCDIIVKKGMIQNVGKNLSAPWDAEIIEADSMYVYAAFICPATHAGYKQAEMPKITVPDPGNPPMGIAGITPQRTVRSHIDRSGINDYKKQGYGYMHILPKGRMLPGSGSVVSTGNLPINKSMISENYAQYAQLASAYQRVYPSNMLGVMASFRNVFKNTDNQKKYTMQYAQNPSGLNRPEIEQEYTALYPVLSGQQKLFFKSPKPKHILRAITLQKELSFSMVLTDVKYISPILKKVKQNKYPILLSLDLPKEVEKKDSVEYSATAKSFEMKRKSAYDTYMTQAKILEDAGVKFAFSGIEAKSGDIKKNIGRLIKAGLSEKGALAALTTNPAQILGITNKAGTVEKGKIANLILTDTSYFSKDSKIRYVLIDGLLEEMDTKKPASKADLSALTGLWSYEVTYGDQGHTGKMNIKKDGQSYTIDVTSDDMPDESIQANNINLEGKKLTFDLEVKGGGQTMSFSYNIEVEEDAMSGTVSNSQMGSFPLTGKKTAPKK